MVQLRLIPVCFATGQAAGLAAALAVRDCWSRRATWRSSRMQDGAGRAGYGAGARRGTDVATESGKQV